MTTIGTYDRAWLRDRIEEYEEKYSLDTEAFMATRHLGQTWTHIPGFDAHCWSSFYREIQEMDAR